MSATPQPSIVWFRQDLRLADNPALLAAERRGAPTVGLYILDDDTPGAWRIGGAARWWLHHSLKSLEAALAHQGTKLVLRRGPAGTALPAFAAEIGAGAVYWNRCYEPFAVARDTAIKSALGKAGLIAESFNGALIAEPWALKTGVGEPYRVFTPFWRALRAGVAPPKPLAEPARLISPAPTADGDRLDDWALPPTKPDWAGGFGELWKPGETGATERLTEFLGAALDRYRTDRNIPGIDGVSRLSPHLHWGEISPGQAWRAAEARGGPDAEPFLRELAWREFSYHLLWQFPALPEAPFSPRFAAFPWAADRGALESWRRGLTGYPFVDAGMRQLWTTGWMHNRVRMVTASFLIKHLLQPWQDGEAWFWDTLVDADLANNAASWQWVAGSGADAAPYFRIFNPVLQGEKFDADGSYVRRWLPELARLPDEWVHRPWMAPAAMLASAGISLGRTYPRPIVDHAEARARALAAFASLKG